MLTSIASAGLCCAIDPMPLVPTYPSVTCLNPGAASLRIACPHSLPGRLPTHCALWSLMRRQRVEGREGPALGPHSGGHRYVGKAVGMGHLQAQGSRRSLPGVSESQGKAAGVGPGGLVWEQAPDPYAQLLPFTAPPSLSCHFSSPGQSSAWSLLLSFWTDKN